MTSELVREALGGLQEERFLRAAVDDSLVPSLDKADISVVAAIGGSVGCGLGGMCHNTADRDRENQPCRVLKPLAVRKIHFDDLYTSGRTYRAGCPMTWIA